ncbi:MAG: HNH endonuclease signature motif containing protein [Candidatus Paceibacterota bacterium]|jgi:hypothetical protein
MPKTNCVICNNEFYAKPSSIIRGWGRYCSSKCQYKSFKTGIIKKCFICDKKVYLTPTRLVNSKSKKYFCSKSCQTKWRNTEFVGSKHANFKDGGKSYQSILKRNGVLQACYSCGEKDVRVLVTHHVDENHGNNIIQNLVWLCHNCHSMIHYDSLQKQKFLVRYNKGF